MVSQLSVTITYTMHFPPHSFRHFTLASRPALALLYDYILDLKQPTHFCRPFIEEVLLYGTSR